jgi:DNA polymerase-1
LRSIIVTGDRDAFQLVSEQTHVWMPGRSKPVRTQDTEYDAEGVVKKMGVRPDQIIDLKALMGDASDNIPGVAGIGEKTAVKLLNEFGTLECIYETIQKDNLQIGASTHPTLKGSLLKKLAEGYTDALLSKRLATIDQESPITLELEKCKLSSYHKDDVLGMFEEFGFKSLMHSLPADEFETAVQGALF